MEVVEEYRARGKIRWVGFSTHSMTPTCVKACESGAFDYINVHYQFIGCNTSTGTGAHKALGGLRANWAVIEAAKAQDMGIFIIRTNGLGPRHVSQICQRSSSEPFCRLISLLVCDVTEPPNPPDMPDIAEGDKRTASSAQLLLVVQLYYM